MKPRLATLLPLISAAIYLGCSAIPEHRVIRSPRAIDSGEAYQGIDNRLAATQQSRIWFEDHTREIVGDALTMIKRNERDGASLDQQWYAFRCIEKIWSLFLEPVKYDSTVDGKPTSDWHSPVNTVP